MGMEERNAINEDKNAAIYCHYGFHPHLLKIIILHSVDHPKKIKKN